jgi:hypothetical protein
LAGEDEEKFAAVAAKDAVDDGLEGVELVVVEGQAEEVAGEGGGVAEEFVGGVSTHFVFLNKRT